MTVLHPSPRIPPTPRPVESVMAYGPRIGGLRRFLRQPAWPLQVVLLGYPVFWALGLGEFSWPIMAVPMAFQLWRRRRPVRVPPYFGVWAALLVWVVAGALLIGQHAPNTLAGSGGFTGWGLRLIDMFAATVVLLYVGNLSEEELPTGKVIRWLGYFFGVVVVGGLLGVVIGHVAFSSPFELLLPHGVRSNFYVHQLVHPAFAQVEDVLGHTSPRPTAPFAYTNSWGNCLSLLLIWFVVGWWAYGSRRSKWFVVAVGCRCACADRSTRSTAGCGSVSDSACSSSSASSLPVAGWVRSHGPWRSSPLARSSLL